MYNKILYIICVDIANLLHELLLCISIIFTNIEYRIYAGALVIFIHSDLTDTELY